MNAKISASIVPNDIKAYVRSKLHKDSRKYSINTDGTMTANIPWHEADREYFQLFKLVAHNKHVAATPVPFSFTNSGMNEPNMVEGTGTLEIPMGCVMVKVGTYPPRITIYTAKDGGPDLVTIR